MTLRNVVVMLVLAILAVLAWISLRDRDTRGSSLPANFPEFTKDEVSRIQVRIEAKSLVLLRRTDRSDAWEAEAGTTTIRADGALVDELLNALLRQDVRDRQARKSLSDADVAGYGLASPAMTIEITSPKGASLVRYGKRTREGTGVYVDSGENTDVWVVGGGVLDHMTTMIQSGARSKRLTDLRLFDVGRVEVVRGGVTTLEASRDATQIWRVAQPYKGFADPSLFEQHLNRLVNSDIVEWAEADAQDLKKYGLDAPAAEVRLSPRKGGEPSVVLLGGAAPEGRGVYAMEKGRPNVAVLPSRLLEAVNADPLSFRDRSFSRIGIDGVAIMVKLGDAAYELRKEGAGWDVTKPARHPGDDAAIRDVMEALRSWKTEEFLDSASPGDFGIADGGDSVEVELQGGGKVTFLLGKEGTDGTRYARRRSADGESGVERVDGTVVRRLAAGYPQFRRKTVRDFSTYMGSLERIARDAGRSEEGQKVQTVVVSQVPGKSGWALATEGPGVSGSIDSAAVARLVGKLSAVVAKSWEFWDASKNEAMGFYPPLAETVSLTLRFGTATGTPPGGAEQVLMVGKKRPEGGYWARFGGDEGWAFTLAEEDLRGLTEPLTK
jgi:hypothetical protein